MALIFSFIYFMDIYYIPRQNKGSMTDVHVVLVTPVKITLRSYKYFYRIGRILVYLSKPFVQGITVRFGIDQRETN